MARTLRADDKEHIINHMENTLNFGEAFDDQTIEVLKSLSSSKLFTIQKLLNLIHKNGFNKGEGFPDEEE